MSQPATWALGGVGTINGELMSQVGKPEVAERLGLRPRPEFIVRTSGVMEADGETPTAYKSFEEITDLPDVFFLAIPSSDDGETAFRYLSHVLNSGKIAVTAEKGGIANHFAELREMSNKFRRLGIAATVGGGTGLIRHVRERCEDIDNVRQIHATLNGTLAAMMDWVAPIYGDKMPLEEAAKKAVDAGYAEPGSDTATGIIKAEAEGDIPKKLSILYNSLGLSQNLLDWNKLRFNLTEEEIDRALGSEVPTRFIVSLYQQKYLDNGEVAAEDGIIGGFDVLHDGWRIVGGFRQLAEKTLFRERMAIQTGEPDNMAVISLGPKVVDKNEKEEDEDKDESDKYKDGTYTVAAGPGAGPAPTANCMLDDYSRLKRALES